MIETANPQWMFGISDLKMPQTIHLLNVFFVDRLIA